MNKTITILLLLCFSGKIFSQQINSEPCGQVGVLDALEKQYPGFKANYEKQYLQQVHPKIVANRKIETKDTFYTYDTTYFVHVVFHVLYNVASENISDALIMSQFDAINQCFRRQNADTTNTRSIFKKRAGDTRIQFVLPTVDPNGAPTNGIIHKYTSKTSFESSQYADEMKRSSAGGNDPWDPTKYLNIWVCNMRYFGQEGLLGYAFPPYGQPNWPSANWVADNRQGVVLFYKIVGVNNPLATAAFASSANGRTAVHEVGHYLGLRHIWGDAVNANRCFVDDYIDDTPVQGYKSNFDCNQSQNSCNTGNEDEPDMVENYMDYSSNFCQNMFTKHQVNVMRKGITEFRTNLPFKTKLDTIMHVFDTVVYNEFKFYVTDKQRIYFELKNADLLDQLLVDIYDMTGNKIISDFQLSKNENFISTAKLATATYVVRVKTNQNKLIEKRLVFITKN